MGVESGGIPDSALSASSSYDPLNVGPQHARLGQDTGGGAWCPRDPVGPDPDTHHQWLGVNLTSPHVISSVLTQGRAVKDQEMLTDDCDIPGMPRARDRSTQRPLG